jgi:hypothetical protein
MPSCLIGMEACGSAHHLGRHIGAPVTQRAIKGRSANKNQCARISMMARIFALRGPDILAQDQPRHLQSLLRRTAGPYIGVKHGRSVECAL